MANVSSSNGIEKYPKLRFPNFTDPWKTTQLRDLFSKNTQKNSKGTVTNVISNSAKNGLIPQKDYFDKDIANADNTAGYYIISKDDFVYNPRKSTDAPYGPISRYTYDEDGIVSPLYLCFRGNNDVNPEFFERFFKSSVWHRYIYMSGDSGARHDRVSIKDETFFEMPIHLPSNEEQKKMATFLSLIEQKIKCQSALVENLKKYKRGVVKTLLDPKQNQHQGVIWKTDTIGNLGTFIKGAALSKADISDSGNPFILYGELYTTYKEIVRTIVRTTQASVDDVYLSKVGDVVIPTSGETPEEISTASCIMVPNVILAGDLNIYRSTIVDGRIMSYLLNHIVNEQITRVAQGKSVVHVQASEIGKISITYPDYNEQERIAEILELIDNRIAISEMSLNSIQEIKKALLQQLFI